MDGSLNRANFADVSTSFVLAAGDNYSVTAKAIIAAKASHTIYVQRIAMGVTTDNAATQTFEDTSGTPVPIATSKASPGLVMLEWDFGPNGVALTEGKGLEMKSSAAGLAASIAITAYRKQTAVTSLSPNS